MLYAPVPKRTTLHFDQVIVCIYNSRPVFFRLVFQPLVSCKLAAWLELASQVAFDYWSLLAAAYPTQKRSHHDVSWAGWRNQEQWIDASVHTRVHLRKGFLTLNMVLGFWIEQKKNQCNESWHSELNRRLLIYEFCSLQLGSLHLQACNCFFVLTWNGFHIT